MSCGGGDGAPNFHVADALFYFMFFKRVTRLQTLFYPTERLTRIRWEMLASLKIRTKKKMHCCFKEIPSLKHSYITGKTVQRVV